MKSYQLFPKEVGLALIVLMVIGMIMLKMIDESMPQYGLWVGENRFINADRKVKMKAIKNSEYPLIDLKRSDISQNGDKKKIMIIGDSYIEGDGYSNLNQTWWRQLELELHDRGYYDVEIYGVGRDSASTYDEMDWLIHTDLIKDIKPDLIMMGYVSNDPAIKDENGEVTVKKISHSDNYFEKNNLLKMFNKYFPNVAYKINNMIQQKQEQKTEYNDETGYPDYLWRNMILNEKNATTYYKRAIQPLSQYLHSINIPSFVVATPNGKNPREENYTKASVLFEKANITYYNMASDLIVFVNNMKDKSNIKINRVNGHPGTAYTKFYAEYIADILEKDYQEVLGNRYEERIKYPICINDWVPYSLHAQRIREEADEVTYKITMPSEENMLYLPIKEKYVKLSLEYSMPIKEIQLEGKELEKASIYVTTINQHLGYDDQTMYLQGRKQGKIERFNITTKEAITSINIQTEQLEGKELEITIKR